MAGMQIDDDEAPEVVTLDEGREEAEKARREEKENKKRVTAEVKERRKSRSERKSKETVSDIAPEASGREVASLPENVKRPERKRRHMDATNSSEQVDEQNPGPVMLDDTVVQFLRAREQQVAKGVSQATHKYLKEKKIKKVSKLPLESATDSRTTIVSLKARPKSAGTTSALDFRREHFFGQHQKRSAAMLPTASKPFTASV